MLAGRAITLAARRAAEVAVLAAVDRAEARERRDRRFAELGLARQAVRGRHRPDLAVGDDGFGQRSRRGGDFDLDGLRKRTEDIGTRPHFFHEFDDVSQGRHSGLLPAQRVRVRAVYTIKQHTRQ